MRSPPAGARPRAPGVVYSTSTLVALLLVATLALTARQPPPPTIAELAPSAVEQIKDAPAEQSSDFGTAANGAGDGATTTTTAPPEVPGAQPVIEVARVRRCIGEPPRQIEDPQSPPCVAYWEGDSGGATSKGVTRDEIRIGVPNYMDDFHPLMQEFFNRRFEFYGRKIRLINLEAPEPGSNAEEQRSWAVRADQEHKIFASTDYSADSGLFYNEELARRGVISAAVQPASPEPHLRNGHPYMWMYPTAVDRMFANIGEWACARLLQGRPAAHAGDPTMRSQPRKLGVVLQWYSPDIETEPDPLLEELGKCETVPAKFVESQYDFAASQTHANTIAAMRQAGVTTIICLCQVTAFGDLSKQATAQGYFPEWAVSTYLLQDYDWALKAFGSAQQLEATFGISFLPRQIPVALRPSFVAAREINPNFAAGGTSGTLQFPKVVAADDSYRSLLLLASGIQMAGPNLTPETFARGLQGTNFPNPEAETRPGKVGFDGDHSMMDDAVEFWWSSTAASPFPGGSPGALCYVDGGRRYRKGEWPREPSAFFTGPCDSGG